MDSQPQEPDFPPLARHLVDAAPVSPPTLSFRWSPKEWEDSQTVLSATSSLLKLHVNSWIAKAKVSLSEHVTAMLAGGHWPNPLTAPAEVEAKLADAAHLLASHVMSLTGASVSGTFGGMLACAVLREHLTQAGLADIVSLRGRAIAPNRVRVELPPTPSRVRVFVIGEEERGVVLDMGFDVELDWRQVALRVLRDCILRSITRCESPTGVSWFRHAVCHGPRQLPICVAIPAPAVVELPVPRQRRRS